MLVTTYRRVFSELSSILKTLSYFRALNIFQMHYKDSTSPWLFLVYLWVSLNQGKRAVTRIVRTQPLNYNRHRIIQAILQKERQFWRKACKVYFRFLGLWMMFLKQMFRHATVFTALIHVLSFHSVRKRWDTRLSQKLFYECRSFKAQSSMTGQKLKPSHKTSLNWFVHNNCILHW